MKRLKNTMIAIATFMAGVCFAAPQIKNVTAMQPWPWEKKVYISYECEGIRSDRTVIIIQAKDKTSGKTYIVRYLSDDTEMTPGLHKVVWDFEAQGVTINSTNVVFVVGVVPRYCVIDLSAGANASSYPVEYMDEPPSGGFNTDTYKMTNLVLRLIVPGSFKMGGKYDVTLTKPFYCGIFEVTQKQYELVKGDNPSYYKGDMRPVESASMYEIGSGDSSFIGRIQTRTGLNFGLPTEAQWEYVCRAGTESDYNNGGSATNDLVLTGRYLGNRSDGKGGYSVAHTTVGSYLPNAWGLYDMHGNVYEYILDWYDSSLSSGTDPVGPSNQRYYYVEGEKVSYGHVIRGGSWNSNPGACTSSFRSYPYRSSRYESDARSTTGFRLVRTLENGATCQSESESEPIHVNSSLPTTVNKSLTIHVAACGSVGESVTVTENGVVLFSTTNKTETLWRWQPLTKGNHTLTCTFGTKVLTKTLNVTALDFPEQPGPNPPMAKDNNVSITPTTRSFGVNGGGNAILVSGSSSTWTAAVSDPWITLNATSGSVGYPVAYTVSANTNVEQRTGYVYVSGWTHTVTQEGVGGTISPSNKNFESAGGSGTIAVSAANKMVWQARPNVTWISVSPTSGAGEGSVTYHVAPYAEVSTRQGTLTVAGNTFTVFQYGRRMKLDSYSVTKDYEAHVIPISVDALAITQWSVTPNNSWISVVDAGNGQGGDLVTIAIAENPSYKARTGTVTIGTETFTVTQQGRTALSFNVSPTASTASVNGANGIIAVTATPDLPWTATSGANWLTVYAATANGAGNGNVVYSASPNPMLSQRTGNITVTPEAASGVAAKTHTVTQPAATSALSSNGYEFEAAGESCSVEVSVANIVQWSISESLDWLTVNGSTSRTGPGTVVLQASANNTVYPRSGTVTIAGKTFSVSQKARGVELEYDTKLFGTDGGYESISIHPDGNVSWTAVASDVTWITIFQGDSGTGDGEILYIVAPYVGDGAARTGWITVGDKKVYISQRAYDLNIEPNGTNVVGNAGAGEFGVSASIGDVWTAIVTEPWITLVSGYDAGTGSGTVRFLYTENTTGKTRTGKIIVAGEVYTLEQRARQMVSITATAEHGGQVSGGGSYDLGTQVTLTAVPDSGYKFSYWTGAVSSMQNPLTVTADVAKSYTAVFEPLPIAFSSVVSDTNGVTLTWNSLAWAGTYRIYRGVTSVPSSATVLVELPNSGNCTYLDETGVVDTEYWYWIEAEGPSDEVMSDPMTGHKEKPIIYSAITYTNLRGATNPNPATYREGTLVSFQNPGAVTGYTFAGWTPSQITANMTGAQTVRAAWTANGYSIAYNPNGGSGTMEATAATYDSEATIAANGFTWTGYSFIGWATNATGSVVYAVGQPVTNLTAQSSGVVTLYAVWETATIAPPEISPANGATFSGDSCTVTITCATEGVTIYYSTNGRTPRFTEANRYTGPFAITDTTTVIAVSVLGDQEEYVEATITKVDAPQLTLAGALDVPSLTVTTDGDAEWMPVSDASAKVGGSCARSGAVGMEQSSRLVATVQGKGTLTFWWKVSCEPDPRGRHTYDNLSYAVDGTDVAWIDGETDWAQQSVTFDADGAHTVCWTYATDDWEETGYSDSGWVDGVVWTPEGGVIVDPLPEVATDSDVTNALAGAADETRLMAHLSGKAKYDQFRAWVNAKGLDHQTVKNSSRAWFAYAIGANGLVEKEFQNGDVTIDSLETGSNGSFTFEVNVKDVLIGAGATAANLATVFDVQGSSSLSLNSFSRAKVNVTLGVSTNGNLLASATPKVECGTFFVRVRMYPDEDVPEEDELEVEDTYTVTYSPGTNGTGSQQTATKTHGVALTLKGGTFTRSGYTQTGWSTSDGGSKAYDLGASYTSNAAISLYPFWTANGYSIAYNPNGGNGTMEATAATYDSEATIAANGFTWTGYSFIGWATNATGSVVYAVGQPVTNLTAQSSGVVTLYAKWTANTYAVTLDRQSGSGGTASVTATYGSAMPSITVPTRSGYTFGGYYTGTNGSGTQYYTSSGASARTWNKTSATTLYAQWTANTYTVTYKPGANGTGSQQTATKTHGVALALKGATFTRSGYTQTGWSTSDGGTKTYDLGASYTSNAAITLYPYWTANTYTVTYKPGANGSGAQQTATKTHGVALTLKGATFTRSGYTQTGWSTSDGGTKTYDLGASYTSNAAITLYPFWTANSGSETPGGVQLWANGPYWAECNVGASRPEEYGYYFWWGDTVGYTNTGSGWISVKDGTSISFKNSGTAASTYHKDNSALLSAGYIDATGNLVAAHDAATAHLGTPWRMPTDAEFSALVSNCTTTWITTNGVYGRLVTGKDEYANRSIFLPAAGYSSGSGLYRAGSEGYYWSSTPDSGHSYLAWYLYFYSGSFYGDYYDGYRYYGLSVRPVRGFAE